MTAGKRPRHPPHDALGLTARQAECLRWQLIGMSRAQIAQRIGLSVGTVKTHIGDAYRALGVSRHRELVEFVMQRSGTDIQKLFDHLRGVKA